MPLMLAYKKPDLEQTELATFATPTKKQRAMAIKLGYRLNRQNPDLCMKRRGNEWQWTSEEIPQVLMSNAELSGVAKRSPLE